MLYLKWLLMFVAFFVIWVISFFFAPIYSLFIVRSFEVDISKRHDKSTVRLERDNLHPWLWGVSTPDNNADEWWYGMYNTTSIFWFARKWTQADYDGSRLIRYFCRVMWFWRNSGYGFRNKWLGYQVEDLVDLFEIGKEDESWLWIRRELYTSYFRIETQLSFPLINRHFSQDFGWQDHRGEDRVTFAGRIISGLRKNK